MPHSFSKLFKFSFFLEIIFIFTDQIRDVLKRGQVKVPEMKVEEARRSVVCAVPIGNKA